MALDPATQAAIEATVNASMDRMFQRMNENIDRRFATVGNGPGGNNQNNPNQDGNNGNNGQRFHANEIGFFDPYFDGKSASTGPPVDNSGKDHIFRDVHVFLNQARSVASIKGWELIRSNLPLCLRGQALIWYTSELTDAERRLYKYGNELDEWSVALKNQFRQSPAKAMDIVTSETYSQEDGRRNREPREYAQTIIRAAQAAELPVYNQMLAIYNGLDIEFQRDLPVPKQTTSLNSFLTILDERKEIWWKLSAARYGNSNRSNAPRDRDDRSRYNNQRDRDDRDRNRRVLPGTNNAGGGYNPGVGRGRNPGYQSGYGGFQAGNYQNPYQSGFQQPFSPFSLGGFQQPFMPAGFQNSQNQWQTYQNRAYQNQQQQQPNQYSNAQRQLPALTAATPMKQIAAPTDSNAQNASNSKSASDSNNRRRWAKNDNKPAGKAYLTMEAEDDPPSVPEPNPLEGYYGGEGYYGNGGYYDDVTSSDDEKANVDTPNDSVDANFSGPPIPAITCHHCQKDFPSNNKLHRHIRERKCSPSNLEAETSSPSKKEVSPEPLHAHHAEIVESSASDHHEPGYGFRGWHYAEASIAHSPDGEAKKACIDSGCTMALTDRDHLDTIPHGEIKKTPQPIRVRGIGAREHDSSEYTELDFYIHGKKADGTPAIAHFKREVHIVDDLKAKMLIGMDIMGPEGIALDPANKRLTVGSCGIVAPLSVKSKGERVDRIMRTTALTTIPPRSTVPVSVKFRGLPIPQDRDYMFHPQSDARLGPDGGFCSHIADANIAVVQVRNATNKPCVLSKNAKVGRLRDYEEQGCYLAQPEDRHLAAVPAQGWKSKMKKFAMLGLATFAGLSKGPATSLAAYPATLSTSMAANPSIDGSPSSPPIVSVPQERVMPNGVTIYGDSSAYNRLSTVAEAYPEIWRDSGGTVNIPEKDWMPIPTIPGAKPEAHKVYPLSPEDKAFVDKEFDRLHQQGKMEWTVEPTPYGFPCFVVWRTVHLPGKPPERKGRVVIDIRGLNKISDFDAYPMQQQADIIAAIMGCPFISVMDAAAFFHQWLVRLADRHKLTVVSHRGSEQWNVAVMGYRNSPAYVQRQIDGILRKYRHFAKAYVDDIVVFSNSLEEHLRHLNLIFALFKEYNIAIKPSKTYLGYPTVSLLGQRVDSLGLATAEEKIEAIRGLKFPRTLKNLETYLGKTGYLRQYIAYYAQKVEPLQQRKTRLLRGAPSKGRARKQHSQKTLISDPTQAEKDAFRQLQGSFDRPTFLVHYDKSRRLFIDVDASKERGYGVVVYHVKASVHSSNLTIPPRRQDIEPIMFLSKILSPAEERYWPTELEMAAIVWTVKKLRTMIISSDHPTVIYTDHSANAGIAVQTKLTSSSVDKLNLKLVRASMYLSQFRLNIHHRPGKSNIVPDALSRLPSTAGKKNTVDSLDIESFHAGILDPEIADPHAFSHSLIAMNEDFNHKIRVGYRKDKHWSRIHAMLLVLQDQIDLERKTPSTTDAETSSDSIPAPKDSSMASAPEKSAEADGTSQPAETALVLREPMPVALANEPIPPVTPPPPNDSVPAHAPSATIPKKDKPIVTGVDFKLHEGLIYHVKDGVSRLCIPDNCQKDVFRIAHDDNFHAGQNRVYRQLAETVYIPSLSRKLRLYLRHCPECQLNQTKRHSQYGEMVPISTSAMPFHTIAMDFVLALPDMEGKDVVLDMVDKASRQLQIIPGESTWTATDWAHAVLERLQIANWGIPVGIICDRDRKWTSEFWRAFFGRLGTSLLMSTAYHAQTDGLSERFNQVVEIALRYLIAENPGINWVQASPALQAFLNNASNSTIGRSPNEVVYGFKVRDVLTALTQKAAITDLDFERYRHQKEASDATSFAMAKAKILYDSRHTPLLLKPGDKAFLRLHHGYTIPSRPGAKLSNQRAGPFLIKRRVGRLAYELELPDHWQVHPVVSVIQLEPAPSEPDPYNRPRPDYPDEVEVEELPNTAWEKNYEVDHLLGKRSRKFGRTNVVQYLVRWKGYGPAYDQWKSIAKLAGCMDLIEKYEREHPAPPASKASAEEASKASAKASKTSAKASGKTPSTELVVAKRPGRPPASLEPKPPNTELIVAKRRGRPPKA